MGNESEESGLLGEAWQMLGHMLITAGLFAAVGLLALALHHYVRWLADQGAPPLVTTVLIGIEYILFGVDALLFLRGLGLGVLRFVRRTQ